MRNKGGRPPLEEGKRSFKIDVRFTEAEYKQVEQLAGALGLNKTAFVRRRVLAETGQLLLNTRELLNALDRTGLELSRTGNNVNQLARYANRLQKHGVLSPVVAHHVADLLQSHNRQQHELQMLFRKLLRMTKP
jgi:hypothetical protein